MSSRKIVLPRAGYATEILFEDGMAHSRRVGDRTKVLKRNQELRKERGAVRDWSFGRLALDIPEVDLPMLDRFFPGLANPAHPDHKWQLRRFMKSPVSAPYRVEDKRRPNAGNILCN